jgi:hypothetical protein
VSARCVSWGWGGGGSKEQGKRARVVSVVVSLFYVAFSSMGIITSFLMGSERWRVRLRW